MTLFRPTRRELIGSIPLLVGAASLPGRLLAAQEEPLLTFFAIGDWGRNGHTNQNIVARRMADRTKLERPAFVASTGDNFYVFGVSGTDDPKWRRSFEDVYFPALDGIPWYAVLGNHDYRGNVTAQRSYVGSGHWNMPYWRDSSPLAGMKRVALPNGSSADFFFVDTVAWIGKKDLPLGIFGSPLPADEHVKQRRWLEAALEESPAKYKFVFGHHGIYSIGPHGGRPLLMDLDRLMRAHNVTAYIHGHDHCLYHVTLDGMSYVCSGGGSEVQHVYKGGKTPGCVYESFCDPQGSDRPFPSWHSYIEDAGFAVVRLYRDGWGFDFVTRNPAPDGMPTRFRSRPPASTSAERAHVAEPERG